MRPMVHVQTQTGKRKQSRLGAADGEGLHPSPAEGVRTQPSHHQQQSVTTKAGEQVPPEKIRRTEERELLTESLEKKQR